MVAHLVIHGYSEESKEAEKQLFLYYSAEKSDFKLADEETNVILSEELEEVDSVCASRNAYTNTSKDDVIRTLDGFRKLFFDSIKQNSNRYDKYI